MDQLARQRVKTLTLLRRKDWSKYFATIFNYPLTTCFRVEKDAQLLANRIALLKQEEMRTWKKIEETKKRAAEVMRLKQRNNEKVAAKIEHMQAVEFEK